MKLVMQVFAGAGRDSIATNAQTNKQANANENHLHYRQIHEILQCRVRRGIRAAVKPRRRIHHSAIEETSSVRLKIG
jgi:uncharacterized protein (UPF0254 family)